MNWKYFIGTLITLPLLPILYFQGKSIRAKVPPLPEATGHEGTCENPSSNRKHIRVIALGESTIAGVGVATHQEGFTGAFAKELSYLLGTSVDWKVYARSGYTAQKVVDRLLPKITESQADVIVIGLGGNDAFTLNRPSKWASSIRSLIASLQHQFPNAILVFCNMPPIKEFPAFTPLIKFTIGNLVEILGERLQTIVREYENVYYFEEKITVEGWMEKFQVQGTSKDFFSDGVHPSQLTYQTWAKEIANGVSQQLTVNSPTFPVQTPTIGIH
ncbi:MAG: SGNH/GDSL hydrolase family protein [Salibacteraceae bacterium]